jgi:carbon starvation protein CstA
METKRNHYKGKAIKAVEKTATTTYKATVTMVKVIFLLIIIYTILMSFYIFLTTETREKFLTDVATISVGGFWAFFLGYFGWRMGQTIESYLHSIKKRK